MKSFLEYNLVDYDIKNESLPINSNIGGNCFGDLVYTMSLKPEQSVHFYIRISYCKYERNEVEKWVDLLNEYGFKCYLKKENYHLLDINPTYRPDKGKEFTEKGYIECYHFEIKLEDCINKAIMLSTLYLLRLLQEYTKNHIPEKVFDILEKNKEINFIQALYLCQLERPSNGHNVFESLEILHIPTVDELWERLNKEGSKLTQSVNTPFAWEGFTFGIHIPTSFREGLAKLIKNKDYTKIIEVLSGKLDLNYFEKIKEKEICQMLK